MEKHYEIILRDTEERVFSRLRSQELDEKSPCYGGFYDRDRMVQAKYTIICVEPMITLYCNPDSRYYRNSLLAQRAELGLSYIRSVQHENGLFDYVTCNFFSAPDTAFCIGFFIPVYEYLQKLGNRTEQEEIFYIRWGKLYMTAHTACWRAASIRPTTVGQLLLHWRNAGCFSMIKSCRKARVFT